MGTTTMAIPGVNSDMTATASPTDWRVGTVQQIRVEAPGVRTYVFMFDGPVQHLSGQHYEIRLTAEDGYQAARLYSAAAPAGGQSGVLQLTIALMPHGEVSSYIYNHVRSGSQLEIRGPLGRYFVWRPEQTEPVLLIGGGTGVIPLRSMLIEHMMRESAAEMVLLYSATTYQDTLFKYDLMPERADMPGKVILTFSERAPRGWNGYARRVDEMMLREVLERFTESPACYVCGPTPFVEVVTGLLVNAGIDAARIRAERFGPTGGS
jgi:ferredoxin-NADP reductase